MTDEQIEKAASDYVSFEKGGKCYPNYAMECACRRAFIDGAQYTLSHQWISVEERLPEDKKAVLCYMPNMKDDYADKDMYFDMAILLKGEFVNLDAEIIHPSHWMPIPIPQLNPEEQSI